MLTASRSLFLYMLSWMIKLILGLVNFLTIQKPELVNMASVSDALKPGVFTGVTTSRDGKLGLSTSL
jgi:hypothetical protein